MDLLELPWSPREGVIWCVVETPRGSSSKLKYDPRLQLFTLSRSLLIGLRYPYDWGFIPSTAGVDGDPLDAMILHDAATYPGMALACRVIGALELQQRDPNTEGRNDRYFAVPVDARRDAERTDVNQLPERERRELEAFFAATIAFEDKRTEVLGWCGPAEAMRRIAEGHRDFSRRRR